MDEILSRADHICLVSHSANEIVSTTGYKSSSIVTKPNSVSRTLGNSSPAISLLNYSSCDSSFNESHGVAFGNFSKVKTNGNKSHAINFGKHGITVASGSNCIGANFNVGSIGSVNTDGVLILAYMDTSGRIRLQVGYEGEDIERGKLYRLDKFNNFEIIPEEEILIENSIQEEIYSE